MWMEEFIWEVCTCIEQWKQSDGPGATAIRFAELAGQVGDAAKVKASTMQFKAACSFRA